MNDPVSAITRISSLFQALAPSSRLEILLAIGTEEACVCHLEVALGQRQAYISQHLMALREAGIIIARREGRYVFYRLVDPGLLDLLFRAGKIAGLTPQKVDALHRQRRLDQCCCPHCAPEVIQV